MNFDEAREIAIQLLRTQGKAKNSELLGLLGGDRELLERVREDLIFNDLAEDKKGQGLVYTGPADTAEMADHAQPEAEASVHPSGAEGGTAPEPAVEHDREVPPSSPPAPRGQIFISYGRQDAKELADRMSVDLIARGYKVWQDVHQIRASQPWHQEIEDGLRSSQIMIALLSRHSVRRRSDPDNPAKTDSVCLDEISYAQELRLPIVPVKAAPCSPRCSSTGWTTSTSAPGRTRTSSTRPGCAGCWKPWRTRGKAGPATAIGPRTCARSTSPR